MSNMTNRDAWVEICVQVMGKELGDLFGLLCKELWGLNDEVSTYIDLFYLSPEDSKLLESAPAFFGIVQTLLQENMALRITRLSDPAAWKTKGEQQPNLTLSKLVEIIGNTHTSPTDLVQVNEKFLEKIKTELFPQITDMLANVKEAAKPFKPWRNKVIAHSDLRTATEGFPDLYTREQLGNAISQICQLLTLVGDTYQLYGMDMRGTTDVGSLLKHLRAAKLELERQPKIEDEIIGF